MKIRKKIIALTIPLACSISMLTGCAGKDSDTISWNVNETIQEDSKWINSSLEKSVDQSTDVSLKDDYYTAVNLEDLVKWEDSISDKKDIGPLVDANALLNEQLEGIMYGTSEIHASNIEMNEEDLNHDIQIVQDFTSAITDWDTRNENGAEALSPYLETIESIQSMDDLNAFILNTDSQALCDTTLIELSVEAPSVDPENYEVVVGSNPSYSLVNPNSGLNYDIYNGDGSQKGYIPEIRDENKEIITNILTKNGYTEDEIHKIINNCYKFESKLASISVPSFYYSTEKFYNEFKGNYTLKQLEKLQNSYPLKESIQSLNYDTEDQYAVRDDDYIRSLGSLYNESNLEEMKDMYIVRTTLAAQSLLDKDTYDVYIDVNTAEDATQPDKDQASETITYNQVNQYLGGPLSVVYVSQYVTSQQKEELTNLTDSIKAELRSIFESETWLSDSTKEKVLDKLDALEEHILYPDTFDSYDFYQVDSNDSLLEMVAKLNIQKKKNDANKINTKVDRSAWNLNSDLSTTNFNCFYNPATNGIYICSGFIAGGQTYSTEMTTEQKYAFCVVLGHEMTHGFDTTGKDYDKYGYLKTWWDVEDTIAFTNQTYKLISYYSSINPYPGSDFYDGNKVSGEAIADLGGMKAALALASEQSDFDYDAFFRAYANIWKEKTCAEYAQDYLNDPHPAGNLRVNVVVSQFDEFIETYDIKKGDGMYVAEADRILVW